MGALVAATPAHAEALAAIHADAFPPAGRWGATAMALQLAMTGSFGWIDPAGGLVLARTVADEAEILTLAVAPEARRRGVARQLLNRAMGGARASGAGSMVLEVGAGNEAAQALYGAAGFERAGLRRRYYAWGEDALIMRVLLCE